jgi:hypothetical protein
VIPVDLRDERPVWLLSCYSHSKGPNDLRGDVSPEEARWQQYQVGGGAGPACLGCQLGV